MSPAEVADAVRKRLAAELADDRGVPQTRARARRRLRTEMGR
jgi:hypothetical protein